MVNYQISEINIRTEAHVNPGISQTPQAIKYFNTLYKVT